MAAGIRGSDSIGGQLSGWCRAAPSFPAKIRIFQWNRLDRCFLYGSETIPVDHGSGGGRVGLPASLGFAFGQFCHGLSDSLDAVGANDAQQQWRGARDAGFAPTRARAAGRGPSVGIRRFALARHRGVAASGHDAGTGGTGTAVAAAVETKHHHQSGGCGSDRSAVVFPGVSDSDGTGHFATTSRHTVAHSHIGTRGVQCPSTRLSMAMGHGILRDGGGIAPVATDGCLQSTLFGWQLVWIPAADCSHAVYEGVFLCRGSVAGRYSVGSGKYSVKRRYGCGWRSPMLSLSRRFVRYRCIALKELTMILSLASKRETLS